MFRHAELPLFVGVVVDDLIAVVENSAVAKFEAFLKKAFPIKCLCEPRLFCGIQVVRVSARDSFESVYVILCETDVGTVLFDGLQVG